jgi:hypothetical protein
MTMSDGRRRAGFLTNRAVVLLTMAVVAIGLTGLSTVAIAATGGGNGGGNGNGNGNGNGGKKHHHKKKKKCKEGFHKESFINKKGKKKKHCVKDAPPTPQAPAGSPAALTITPTNFDFGNAQHHSGPCSGCPTKAFTVTNSGGLASGTLAVSVTATADPVTGDDEAFQTISNGCGAALAVGASCTVTMGFSPVSNGGTGDYASDLRVTGAPGGTAQAQMLGHAQ